MLENIPAWADVGLVFHQHVHVAAGRIEIVAQHRAEQTELADSPIAAEGGNRFRIDGDGQLGDAHGALA